MPVAVSDSGLSRVFEHGLAHMVNLLERPERALVLYQKPDEDVVVMAAHGVEQESVFREALLSLSVLRRAQDERQAIVIGDIRESPDIDQLSLVLSGIQSYLCVPFEGPAGGTGLLYADTLGSRGPFSEGELEQVCGFARELEDRLELFIRRPHSARAEYTWPAAVPRKVVYRELADLTPKQAVVPTPTPGKAEIPTLTPSLEGQVVFFRCLATMVAAGIHILEAFRTLAKGSEDPAIPAICNRLEYDLLRGQSLTRAIRLQPNSFSEQQVSMVEIGEATGRLHLTLAVLASWEERRLARARQLKSALYYPAILFVACFAMMLLVPPFVLEGHFQLLRDWGVEPPFLTKCLMALSTALRDPAIVGVSALALVAGLLGCRSAWRTPSFKRRLLLVLHSLPSVGPVVKMLACSRFANSLSAMLKVGLPWTQALPLAGKASGDPVTEAAAVRALKELKEGGTVAESLKIAGAFPVSLVALVSAGEESGQMPATVERAALLYDLESETALDSLNSILEPFIMLFMGGMVALMLIGTLLPLSEALQVL